MTATKLPFKRWWANEDLHAVIATVSLATMSSLMDESTIVGKMWRELGALSWLGPEDDSPEIVMSSLQSQMLSVAPIIQLILSVICVKYGIRFGFSCIWFAFIAVWLLIIFGNSTFTVRVAALFGSVVYGGVYSLAAGLSQLRVGGAHYATWYATAAVHMRLLGVLFLYINTKFDGNKGLIGGVCVAVVIGSAYLVLAPESNSFAVVSTAARFKRGELNEDEMWAEWSVFAGDTVREKKTGDVSIPPSWKMNLSPSFMMFEIAWALHNLAVVVVRGPFTTAIMAEFAINGLEDESKWAKIFASMSGLGCVSIGLMSIFTTKYGIGASGVLGSIVGLAWAASVLSWTYHPTFAKWVAAWNYGFSQANMNILINMFMAHAFGQFGDFGSAVSNLKVFIVCPAGLTVQWLIHSFELGPTDVLKLIICLEGAALFFWLVFILIFGTDATKLLPAWEARCRGTVKACPLELVELAANPPDYKTNKSS